MTERPDDSKRKFLRDIATGVIATSLGALVVNKLIDGEDVVETLVIPKLTKNELTERIQNLAPNRWVRFDKEISLRLGQAHPEYARKKSPSFQMAVEPFHFAQLDLLPNAQIGPCLDRLEMTSNLVTFGSPASNQCVAQLMGHHRDPDDPLTLRRMPDSQQAINFPINFMLEATKDRLIRRSMGAVYHEPRWGVEVAGEGIFFAKSDQGELASDYLVITRMRFDQNSDNTFLNFAGLHGPGTAAVKLLFENNLAFETLERAIRARTQDFHQSWQALVPVSQVKNVNGTHRPMEIDYQSIIVRNIPYG